MYPKVGAWTSKSLQWLGFGLNNRGLYSKDRHEICLFSKMSRLVLWPTQRPINGVWRSLSSWVKQPMSEGVHSPPSSAGDKNEWIYTFKTCILLFIFSTFLHVKDMWYCTLKLSPRLHYVGGEKVWSKFSATWCYL